MITWEEYTESLELPDFVELTLTVKSTKIGDTATVGVDFNRIRSKDLMVRGGDFYAIRDPETQIWSRDEMDVIERIDNAMYQTLDYLKERYSSVKLLLMKKASTGSLRKFHDFVKQLMRDHFHQLDQKIIFSNHKIKATDYASRKLPYPLAEGPIDAYEEIMSTLYSPEQREKIEWVFGAVIDGAAKHIQKILVLYGPPGAGKGTVIDIGELLFKEYSGTWDSREVGAGGTFALEDFKDDPLVSFDHDGDLSRITDNTTLNKLISHENVVVNAKYTKKYTAKFNTFLITGSNKPVKITDAKSGIIRRLIDAHPSGNKIPTKRYLQLKKQVEFELSGIAWHCLNVFRERGESYYNGYIATEMISETNDFYDFIVYKYDEFLKRDMVTKTEAWAMYNEYCDYAGVKKMTLRPMASELRNYFREFYDRKMIDGKLYRSLYFGFMPDKFLSTPGEKVVMVGEPATWLEFKEIPSLFDAEFANSKAQYAKEDGSPVAYWVDATTTLSDIDTHKLHWVKPSDPQIIAMDFDIPDENGNKDLKANMAAASEWPKTYAELSKSGGGIHLVYRYDGDVDSLSRIIADHVELKVFTGNASMRRMLTKCNDIPIATISSGLPLKEVKKVVNWEAAKTDRELRRRIIKALKKEYHPDTSSSIDLIKKMLDDAYESGLTYQIDDQLQQRILLFAMNATNQSDKCIKQFGKMHFVSKDIEDGIDIQGADPEESYGDDRLVFFDCEVYPNLFLICWKYENSETVVSMVNPTPEEVRQLLRMNLIGYNNIYYDNHILYARAFLGYSNRALFELSQSIIVERKGSIQKAKSISYTDVLDFITEKKSLKKWEIDFQDDSMDHMEMSIPWDQDVPEDMIPKIVEYCCNDVKATEMVFHERKGDFMARKIQVELVKLLHNDIKVTVNDTTNTLSKRFIFGNNRSPQGSFNYRNLAFPVGSDRYEEYLDKFGHDYKFRVFNSEGLPEYRDYIPGEVLPPGWSILPFFPGYEFGWSNRSPYYNEEVTKRVGFGKSLYLGDIVGEGGRVYSSQGLWLNVWDGDISSMHPHSIIAEVLFGPKFTKIFADMVKARVAIKHKDFKTASELLEGALKPFLKDEYASDLAQALKIVINSIYGLTSAKFENEFRDQRNEDNIVAKRGALFMSLLKREVERLGYTVCHIKTDSIKIPDADDYIKNFVIRFGREYGYEFETEAVFTKFCLLNDAAYVGKERDGSWITKAKQLNKDTAPFTYKTLFSHEPIEFRDLRQTFSVNKGAIYIDFNENLEPALQYEKLLDKKIKALKKLGVSEIEIEKDEDVVNLKSIISGYHNYQFIGRVSSFCPVIDGVGGGELFRIDNGKAYAVGGTSDYKWLESAYVKTHGGIDIINMNYYRKLVDDTVEDISKLCNKKGYDFEWFVS